MIDIAKVLIFSLTAYVVLFLIAKLLGKKQLAQLTFIDYIVGISIGSIAAEMATELNQPFYHYLIAMAAFFLFDLIISVLGRKGVFLKKFANGTPLIIMEDGKLNYENLKKSKITVNEFCGMAREKGFFHLEDIAYAIFETSGKLSILPKSNQRPVVAEDFNLAQEKPELVQYLVVDGSISKESLSVINKNEEWLLEGLKVKDENELKNILLAYYEQKEQNFLVHYKKYQE